MSPCLLHLANHNDEELNKFLSGSSGQTDTKSIVQESFENSVKCGDCSTTASGRVLENDSLCDANYQANNHDQDLQDDDDDGIDMADDAKSRASVSNESGPFIYELFANSIHSGSGSASCGHYYTHIKGFESRSWYSFNDQTVSSLAQEDIQKSIGGSAHKT